jgi:branched-chain amino acid transport system substrate-binding protein
MKKEKGFGKVLFFLSLVGFLVAPCGTAFSQPHYKVGYLNSHSGFMAFMGTAHRNGFLLGVDEINGTGGINGRKLDVVIYDDESDVAKGVLAYKKLINVDNVLVTTGISHSGVAIACAKITEDAKVPYVAVGSSRWIVAKPGKWKIPADPTEVYDYVVRFRVDAQIHLGAMYDFAKKMGVKKFAWMSAGTAYGKSAREFMEATYKLVGLECSAAEEYGPNDSVMASQLTRIKATNFDAIIIYSAEPAGALVYKQAREMGITKPIIADSPIIATSIMKTLGQYLTGLYVCIQIVDVPDLGVLQQRFKPMTRVIEKFRQSFKEKYGYSPDCWNAYGYDGAMWVGNALKRAAPDPTNLKASREKIRDALLTTKGYAGTWGLGEVSSAHELPCPVTMIKIEEDQKLKLVE